MISRSDPDLVWHYTNFHAFAAILKRVGNVPSAVFRASHAEYLNDWSEATILYQSIREKLLIRLSASPSNEWEIFFRKLLQEFGAPDVPKFNASLIKPFIVSLSGSGDDLSQWRAYANPTGCALGFSLNELKEKFGLEHEHGIELYRCNETSTMSALVDDMVNSLELGPDPDPVAVEMMASHSSVSFTSFMSMHAPRYKHPSFSQENEWRVCLPERQPGVHVDANGNLVRHETIDLGFALRAVTIGPTPPIDRPAKERAVGQALKNVGFNYKLASDSLPNSTEVVVSSSSIPFRSG